MCVCVWGGGRGRLNQLGINRKGPNLNYSEHFGTQKIGDGYEKFRLNGSKVFNKITGVGILEYLLVAKSEGNCIRFEVSHFLILMCNIIAKF